jgi:hypothetical protein
VTVSGSTSAIYKAFTLITKKFEEVSRRIMSDLKESIWPFDPASPPSPPPSVTLMMTVVTCYIKRQENSAVTLREKWKKCQEKKFHTQIEKIKKINKETFHVKLLLTFKKTKKSIRFQSQLNFFTTSQRLQHNSPVKKQSQNVIVSIASSFYPLRCSMFHHLCCCFYFFTRRKVNCGGLVIFYVI